MAPRLVVVDERAIGPTMAVTRSGLAIPIVVIDDAKRRVVAAREHPAIVRLTHWLNAVSLVVLTMSGLGIFSAFPSFGAKIPQVDLAHVPSSLRLGGWLGGALQWHLTFAWIFSLTGLVYAGHLALSGHWRHVLLRPRDVNGVWPMVRHYFLFGPKPVPVEPYNPLQKLAYTTTLGFGLLAVLSGLALARPVQFGGGPSPVWGFAAVRMIHFGAMLGFAAFIPGHLLMVAWHGWSNFASMWTGWKKGPDYLRITAFITAVVLASALPAHAQTGRVAGRVVDQTGAVLPGVTIDLVGGGTELTAATDHEGRYQFDHVPAGTAELTFRLINFSVLRRTVTVGREVVAPPDTMLTLAVNADVVVTAPGTFRNIADIENPAENLVGIAAAASQGAVTAAQLDARPVMRPGEVLETVPGLIISQHSGEGKANQYYLRGFNLDHGTDFSTTVAGVPVNTPTGAHAHGYADVNFLIPELVSGVQYKKGPYFADEGDFSAAGAATINYVNRLERPELRLSGGNEAWGRVFGAASPRVGSGFLLGAFEANHNDGPWIRPDDYRKLNGVLRYSQGDNRNGFSVTGMGYWSEWDSTDQVAQRAIDSGQISRFGHLDSTDGGRASRQSAAFELQRSAGPSSIRATGFVLHNSLNLFSNFTYFLDDPERGDQFEQAERRTTVGGRVTYRRLGRFFERHTESAVGIQVRRDWLDPVGLYHTQARERLSTTREDEVGQTMTGVFAQTEIEWTRTLRTTLGVRADAYQFSVTSDKPTNSGDGSDQMVSPKFGAVFGPWAGTELYANAGMGFHSNDARGAVIRVDPTSGDAVDPVTPLVRARGAEFGVRTVRIRGLQSTVAVWYLGLDSELLFVGDAGTTEPGRPSRRVGIEWANYARLAPWLTVDADLAFTRARFTDHDPAGTRIPGALDRVISAGVTVEPSQPLFGSLRVRHFGPRPLIEDASVTSDSTMLWNGEAGYRLSPRARVVLEVFNIFDAKVSDIDYFYASRLPGEPLAGVGDIHLHPALPRTARIGVQFSF